MCIKIKRNLKIFGFVIFIGRCDKRATAAGNGSRDVKKEFLNSMATNME